VFIAQLAACPNVIVAQVDAMEVAQVVMAVVPHAIHYVRINALDVKMDVQTRAKMDVEDVVHCALRCVPRATANVKALALVLVLAHAVIHVLTHAVKPVVVAVEHVRVDVAEIVKVNHNILGVLQVLLHLVIHVLIAILGVRVVRVVLLHVVEHAVLAVPPQYKTNRQPMIHMAPDTVIKAQVQIT
jgi:hypothetical protein